MNDKTQASASTAVAPQQPHSLVSKTAARFGVDPGKLLSTLKATCFKVKDGEVSNEQMMALLVVADQYGLNPFTRELFAFPDKQNGIVPVVGVDGWSRIINQHPQLDGIEFRYSPEMIEVGTAGFDGLKAPAHAWIECVISRKDRAKPIVVREFLQEVYRKPFKKQDYVIESAWQTHTNRFLRHKSLIQCARLAMGFSGIYDEDEAQRILEASVVHTVAPAGKGTAGLKQLLTGGASADQVTDKTAPTSEPPKSDMPATWHNLTTKDEPAVWVAALVEIKDPKDRQALVEYAMGLDDTEAIVKALEAKMDDLVFGS